MKGPLILEDLSLLLRKNGNIDLVPDPVSHISSL